MQIRQPHTRPHRASSLEKKGSEVQLMLVERSHEAVLGACDVT